MRKNVKAIIVVACVIVLMVASLVFFTISYTESRDARIKRQFLSDVRLVEKLLSGEKVSQAEFSADPKTISQIARDAGIDENIAASVCKAEVAGKP